MQDDTRTVSVTPPFEHWYNLVLIASVFEPAKLIVVTDLSR